MRTDILAPHTQRRGGPSYWSCLSRWKHLKTLTQDSQEPVIIALIVYTLTINKVRSIATLKFVGAPDRTIVGLIVQQALSVGIFGYLIGLALVLVFKLLLSAAAGAGL